MLYTKQGSCRLYWNRELGWVIEVPTALTQEQLHRITRWALPKQVDRWRNLPPGNKKDELGHAIEHLKQGRILQRLIDHDGDGVFVPFASTERATTRRYLYG